MHRVDDRFEDQVAFWKADSATNDNTVIRSGPQLPLYLCANCFRRVLKPYESDIDLPTSFAHLLHARLDARLDLLGGLPWRSVGEVLRKVELPTNGEVRSPAVEALGGTGTASWGDWSSLLARS